MTKVKLLGSSRKPSTSAGFNDTTAMLGHIKAKARNDPIHFALYQYFQIKYKEPAMPTTTFNPVAQRKPPPLNAVAQRKEAPTASSHWWEDNGSCSRG